MIANLKGKGKMNKKAQSIVDLIVLIVIGIVAVLFFAGWMYGFGLITDSLTSIITPTNDIGLNISDAAQKSFGQVNTGLQRGLPLIAFAMFFGMVMSIFLSNFLIKVHPAFFIVYLFVLVGAIILSIYVSNTYETLLTNEVLGGTLQSFSAMTFIMLYLPLWITVIGFIGAIFLFAGIQRDPEQGGGFG